MKQFVMHVNRAKSHQLPYPVSSSTSKFPLELVFSNVWGDAPESVGKKILRELY